MSDALPFLAEVTMTPAAAEHHTVESVLTPARESLIDLTIFISCYNEEPYIITTLETVKAAISEAGGISYQGDPDMLDRFGAEIVPGVAAS